MLSNSEEEVRKLVTQQEEDSSLLEMRSKASKQDDGYCWENRHTTVHSNRLKAWKTPTANLFQVVVADEFEVNPEPIGKVKMGVTHLKNSALS